MIDIAEAAKPLPFTGERYVPDLDSAEISYEHWHRYLFARDYAAGRTVIDVASGEGYGAALLAEVAARVIGVDADAGTVEHAAARYRRDNLEFRVGAAEAIPVEGEAAFDLIVSFETIEHLDAQQQERFLAEAKRLLKPDGRLLISTPNKRAYTDAAGIVNPFHRREFYEDEFAALLGPAFRCVRFLGQRVYPVSYLWPTGANGRSMREQQITFADGRFGPPDGDGKESVYVIAVCSDAEVEPPAGSILLDVSERATRHRLEECGRQQALAARAAADADALRASTVAERDRADRAEAALADMRVELQKACEQVRRTREQLNATESLLAHERCLAAVRRFVGAHVAAEATVAVVSRGDESLLDHSSRAWHFPRAADGGYAGYYPADDTEAIIHLECLRAAGADFLLLPAPAFWWLDHYAGLRRHLENRYLLARCDDNAILFDLRKPVVRPTTARVTGRATVIVPGSVNYFHNRAGGRLAAALNRIGVTAEVATLDTAGPGGDWCFLINPYEVAYGAGGDAAIPRLESLHNRFGRCTAVLMECAETQWFGMSVDVCRRAGIDRVLDLGFHGQYESIPEWLRPTYHFAFSGLTGAERDAALRGRTADDRPIPWVFIGHLAHPRLRMLERLLRSADPGGFIYMPNIGPVRDRGPHINGEQLERILRRARRQVWCTHHGRYYMESERFRDSLLAGCIPAKLDTAVPDRPDYLPFRYLTMTEEQLVCGWNELSSSATWDRFAAEFTALPTLEESMAAALREIERREAGHDR